MARRIAVLSTGRQDWGILRSTCRLLRDDAGFELALMLGGMHCAPQFGLTKQYVEAEGFDGYTELPWIPKDHVPSAPIQSCTALGMVSKALEELRPEALMLVGDRFETASAALAATLLKIPIIHLHGGEETEGAIDNALRHAITKLSHLHFVSHMDYAERVRAMGEDPAAIHNVGAPGLDNLHRPDLLTRDRMELDLGIELSAPVVLVTLHPSTLLADPASEARALAHAMDQVEATYIVSLPNTDPGHESVRAILANASLKPRRVSAEALGDLRYWSLLRIADAVVGNSSSALIEAPAVGLPAVNIGDRQKGRIRASSVIDCKPESVSVAAAMRKALSSEFRASANKSDSPFGDGHSGERILTILRGWAPPNPPIKRFFEND